MDSSNSISIGNVNIQGFSKSLDLGLDAEINSIKSELENEIRNAFSDVFNSNTTDKNISQDSTNVSDDPASSTAEEESNPTQSNAKNDITIDTVNIYMQDILDKMKNENSSTDKSESSTENLSTSVEIPVVDNNTTTQTNFSHLPFTVPSEYQSIISKMSEKYNVPSDLIASVIQAESNYKSNAVSYTGAQGLMQLMPETAKELGVSNSFNVEQNIEGGTKYLSKMLSRYDGDTSKALAAYNAGAGNVDKYNGIPPFKETQNYVSKILGFLGK